MRAKDETLRPLLDPYSRHQNVLLPRMFGSGMEVSTRTDPWQGDAETA